MKYKIGEMSGKVWQALRRDGEMTLSQLKKALSADSFLLNAAIGWLAREDKIEVVKYRNTVKIYLKIPI
ncbi:MAG: winged helix-turn-helix domain-containing protein [Calditrichaceae bacterium]